MSPKQCRVPASTATTVKMKQVERAEGGQRRRHGDENMNTRGRGREEHSRCMGEEGRQADGARVCGKIRREGKLFQASKTAG